MSQDASQKNIAIISGGCGGIGRAISARLAQDGFTVVALYRTTPPDEATAIIQSFGPGEHRALCCDINNPNAVTAMFQNIVEQGGHISVAIHAAVDPILRKNALEMKPDELTAQLGTGLMGGFNFLTSGARAMKEDGNAGSLIGILSPVATPGVSYPRMAGYSIEKSALRALLKELHKELATSAIRVAAIAPGFMDTKLNADLPAPLRQFMMEHRPDGEIDTPEAAAQAVAFLVSNGGATLHNGMIFSFDPKKIQAL